MLNRLHIPICKIGSTKKWKTPEIAEQLKQQTRESLQGKARQGKARQ
jgi:hypothetical protein